MPGRLLEDDIIEMLRQQEGRDSRIKQRDPSPRLLEQKQYEQMLRENTLLNQAQIQAVRSGHPMGELAALDRYGVEPGVVGQPLPLSGVDRALQLAGRGVPEDKYRSHNRFPDAISENQRRPPAPPFFSEDTPDWATRQQGTPQFWINPDLDQEPRA